MRTAPGWREAIIRDIPARGGGTRDQLKLPVFRDDLPCAEFAQERVGDGWTSFARLPGGNGTLMQDRFELRELLGEGGMARVHAAWDRLHGREVALKTPLPATLSDPASLERFRREAATAVRLAHPNVVTAYELVQRPEGPTLVMERIHGETLRQRLDRMGPLPEDGAVGILSQALDALSFAHAQGVLHRDLCPRNLLIEPSGRVALADFGLARMAGDLTLTRPGDVMGSVKYMAPEAVRGEAVGPEADLYALGAVAYEMLSGTPPFQADTAVGIAMKHVNEEPAPLAGISPVLESVVRRALAKDPADRFRSAAEMRAALTAPLDLDRTLTRPPGWLPPPAPRRSVLRSLPVAAALLLGLFLLFALTLSAGRGRDGEPRAAASATPQRMTAATRTPTAEPEVPPEAAPAAAPEPVQAAEPVPPPAAVYAEPPPHPGKGKAKGHGKPGKVPKNKRR